MKPKIALLTIHWANSYGGTLQALATQTILSRYGDVSIIDYKTEHLNKTMKVLRYGYTFRDFLRMGKDITRLFPRYRLLTKFKFFFNRYYNLTPLCISEKDLQKLEKDYDIFICGSDQIWNPNIINNFDGAYFLNFIDKKKKIAYASSAGSYKFSKSEQNTLINYLESFSNISLREKNTADYISSILKRNNISNVLDPTLMLNKKEWYKLLDIQPIKKIEPYLFVYTLRKDTLVREIITQVARTLNLQIIAIDQDPYLGYKVDKHIRDADPKEYIELISNASFVITNSFHGTVFATNFEVPFLTIKPESGLNRIEGFLKSVDLTNRLILNNNNFDSIINSSVNFSTSTKKLELLRESSFSYLDQALILAKN